MQPQPDTRPSLPPLAEALLAQCVPMPDRAVLQRAHIIVLEDYIARLRVSCAAALEAIQNRRPHAASACLFTALAAAPRTDEFTSVVCQLSWFVDWASRHDPQEPEAQARIGIAQCLLGELMGTPTAAPAVTPAVEVAPVTSQEA